MLYTEFQSLEHVKKLVVVGGWFLGPFKEIMLTIKRLGRVRGMNYTPLSLSPSLSLSMTAQFTLKNIFQINYKSKGKFRGISID